MPRFVILYHDMPAGASRDSHWDLMLEAEGGLRTWALTILPRLDCPIAAQPLPDHRLAYLDYEGPISPGPGSQDRGSVTQWDAGVFDWLQQEPHRLQIRLNGRRLRGTATLQMQAAGCWELLICS